MKIRTRTFTWVDGFPFSRSGWKPTGSKKFDPGSPHHVAHDVIEHLSDKDDFEHEMMAFGVTLYGRGAGNPHPTDMAKSSGYDMAQFLMNERYKVGEVPHHAANISIPADAETLIGITMESGAAVTRNEKYNGNYRASMQNFASLVPRLKQWMRYGYKIAERVYHSRPSADIFGLFDQIHGAVIDEYQAFGEPQNGDKLVVCVDLETLKFTIARNPSGADASKHPVRHRAAKAPQAIPA